MKSEWKKVLLGDVCTKITSGGTPKSSFPNYYGGDIPWLRTQEINFSDIERTELHITQEGLNNSSAKWIPANAVIVAMYGATAGKSAISKIPLTTNQACCNLVIDESKADFRYIYYQLKLDYEKLASLANGGAQQNLNARIISDYELNLPDLPTQRVISDTLYALDEKIANNKKVNHHLAAAAQAVFERLIIEDALDEPLGVLSDIAVINPLRPLQKGKEARYIEMANLPTSGSFPSNWTKRAFSGGMKFKNGDTIMARITPCLENGKTAYINFLGADEIAFGSTEYIVIAPKPSYCNEMFYFFARNSDFLSYAVKNMNGSSGRQRISGDAIGAYELHIPSRKNVEEFAELARPVMETIAHNALENRNLADIRDTLLPRLMSGELSVADLAKFTRERKTS